MLVVTRPSQSTSLYTIHAQHSAPFIYDIVVIAIACYSAFQGGHGTWLAVTITGLWLRVRTTSVLKESILAIRGLGLQLSTTRGLVLALPFCRPRSLELSTTRLFVPLSSISDIVVNEGIWRWQIIYYLIIVQNEKADGPTKLEIGFRELLPRLAQVRRVWAGIRHTLFDELDLPTDNDTDTGKL